MSDVTIVQADRAAAAKFGRELRVLTIREAVEIEAGENDTLHLVQAFARHRQTSTEDLVEALRRAPIIGRGETYESFSGRQDYWLNGQYRIALNKAGAL